ncbi:hypothetical protein [Bradyrhizobium sp. B117]|uniref:hypothetical protein n=1 Tax=Bradyrhizobium sp. B117 TaxID=3140246 RepID=UPI0031835654
MSRKFDNSPADFGIDIGKNSFHLASHAVPSLLRQKWSRSRTETRLSTTCSSRGS